MRRQFSSRCPRSLLACAALASCLSAPSHGAHLESTRPARVLGTVSALVDSPARLVGAHVLFQGERSTTKAVTNDIGEFETSLEPDESYAIRVEDKGFCTIHRPPIRMKPGSKLRFDFKMVLCPQVNRITVGPPEAEVQEYPIRYYESSVDLGKRKAGLILAFGTFKKSDGREVYGPLPLTGKAGSMPVRVAFQTYTIEADSVTIDSSTKTLKADGHVLVVDGGLSPPRSRSCVVLRVSNSNPKVESCSR